MDPLELIFVPLVVFVAVVLPIWILFHYITIWKREKRDRRTVSSAYQDLEALAERMEQRIDVIERLLDTEEPRWRKNQ